MWWQRTLWLVARAFSLCAHMVERKGALGASFMRPSTVFIKVPPWWPKYLPRAPLVNPWRLGFQHRHSGGGHKHSDHNREHLLKVRDVVMCNVSAISVFVELKLSLLLHQSLQLAPCPPSTVSSIWSLKSILLKYSMVFTAQRLNSEVFAMYQVFIIGCLWLIPWCWNTFSKQSFFFI